MDINVWLPCLGHGTCEYIKLTGLFVSLPLSRSKSSQGSVIGGIVKC